MGVNITRRTKEEDVIPQEASKDAGREGLKRRGKPEQVSSLREGEESTLAVSTLR